MQAQQDSRQTQPVIYGLPYASPIRSLCVSTFASGQFNPVENVGFPSVPRSYQLINVCSSILISIRFSTGIAEEDEVSWALHLGHMFESNEDDDDDVR